MFRWEQLAHSGMKKVVHVAYCLVAARWGCPGLHRSECCGLCEKTPGLARWQQACWNSLGDAAVQHCGSHSAPDQEGHSVDFLKSR